MKNRKLLLTCASVTLALYGTAAVAKHMPPSYKLTNMYITQTKKGNALNIDCAAHNNQTYHFNIDQKRMHFSKHFYITDTHWKIMKMGHGLIGTKWHALAVYIDSNGKKHKSKAYGRGLSTIDSHHVVGVFNNGWCRGFYKSRWSNKT